jgi:hypothetical protein
MSGWAVRRGMHETEGQAKGEWTLGRSCSHCGYPAFCVQKGKGQRLLLLVTCYRTVFMARRPKWVECRVAGVRDLIRNENLRLSFFSFFSFLSI